jgi:hypothetical protein
MAQKSNKPLGKTLEMKICPKYAPKSTYNNAGENSGLQLGNMLSGKFAMVKVPYSRCICGIKCHPYDWKKIYKPTKITFRILPRSK